MAGDCEHEWRRGPMVVDRLDESWQAVCVRCWGTTTLDRWKAQQTRPWTEQDYWAHLDQVEGNCADEIRRTQGRITVYGPEEMS